MLTQFPQGKQDRVALILTQPEKLTLTKQVLAFDSLKWYKQWCSEPWEKSMAEFFFEHC